MLMKCLSFVTSLRLLFNATDAMIRSVAGIGFPLLCSSRESFRAVLYSVLDGYRTLNSSSITLGNSIRLSIVVQTCDCCPFL